MTDEELDLARIREARHRYDAQRSPPFPTPIQILAALCREGWTPPPVVERLIGEARKIIADGSNVSPGGIMAGEWDHTDWVRVVLAGIKRGIEIERQDVADHERHHD